MARTRIRLVLFLVMTVVMIMGHTVPVHADLLYSDFVSAGGGSDGPDGPWTSALIGLTYDNSFGADNMLFRETVTAQDVGTVFTATEATDPYFATFISTLTDATPDDFLQLPVLPDGDVQQGWYAGGSMLEKLPHN